MTEFYAAAVRGGWWRGRGGVRMGSTRWFAAWKWCVGEGEFAGLRATGDEGLRLEGITLRPGVMQG